MPDPSTGGDRQRAVEDASAPDELASAARASAADLAASGALGTPFDEIDTGRVWHPSSGRGLPELIKSGLQQGPTRLRAMLPRRFKGAVSSSWAYVRMWLWWIAYRLAVIATVKPEFTAIIAPRPRPLPLVWVRRSAIVRYFRSSSRFRRERWGLSDSWWNQMMVYTRTSVFEPATAGEMQEIIHETVRGLFLERRPFRSTRQYREMIRAVAVDDSRWSYGCRSQEEVDDYFERLIGAHRSMAAQGFRTQRELGGLDRDEIPVYVARDGVLCQGSAGSHRIRIAELLGIEWVPVVVHGFHVDYLRWICREHGLPAHRAVEAWMRANDCFSVSRPLPAVAHVDRAVVVDRYRKGNDGPLEG